MYRTISHSKKTIMENVCLNEQTVDDEFFSKNEDEDLLSPEQVVSILPQVVFSGGWDKCWAEGVTPWDLGRPTPIILHLLQAAQLPNGKALVPGCGSGYDVVAMASPERSVIGLDISEKANKKATQMAESLPNGKYVSFLKEDFFTWRPTHLFDLIFDYVFFCAFEVEMRPAWAKSVAELLKPDGELITLMYPIGDHEGGPPYKATVADYEEVLLPFGFKAVSIVDNELAVGPRKGREKLGRWKRTSSMDTIS